MATYCPADRILVTTALFTGAPDEPAPGAVAIGGDRILWAGPLETMPEALRGDATEVIDYGDALIMPGFHDAHLHYFHSALYLSPLAERFVGENEADAVARLAPLAARRPADSWLLTQGWRDYLWNPAGMPSRASLDAAYPTRPVAMYSGDAHTLWLNSCALERLGITEESEPPAGGSYDKDADGRLTGIVREAAAMELMPRIVAEFSREELLDAYRSFERYLNEHGITGVCDVSLMAMPGLDFVRDDLFGALEEAGELTVRVSMFPTLLEDRSRLAALQAAHTGPLLSARGFKQFFDGVSSQHTAWVHDPYTNARFEGDCGRPTVGAEVMEALVAPAAAEGSPVRIHAIGDEAIHRCLDIFEAHPAPAPAHHAIEHLENFQPNSPATSPWIPAARSAIWGPSASLICGPSARFWIPAPPWPSAPTPPLPISIPSTLSTPPSPAATPIPTSRLGAGCPRSASLWPRPCAPTPPAAPPPPSAPTNWDSWPRACSPT